MIDLSPRDIFLTELKEICAPHSYAPCIAAILSAIDADSIRETTLAVGAALRDPMLRSPSLRVAIRDWYRRVIEAREQALNEAAP